MHDLFEFLIRFVAELVGELLIKGPEYLIIRFFRPDLVTDSGSGIGGADGCLVGAVGLAFWTIVFGAIWLCFR